LLKKFLSVPIRKTDIQHHQVELLALQHGGGFRQIVGTGDRQLVSLEYALEQISDDEFILDDQYLLKRHFGTVWMKELASSTRMAEGWTASKTGLTGQFKQMFANGQPLLTNIDFTRPMTSAGMYGLARKEHGPPVTNKVCSAR
jgi:hypothetical protein